MDSNAVCLHNATVYAGFSVMKNCAVYIKDGKIADVYNERRFKQKKFSPQVRIIDLMGLEKYRKAYPGELSTSAEQKIVIGRAFAMDPDLLLMDEPYGQMDVKTRFYLEDEVIRIWKEYQKTVVFITHNIEEAVYLAERVLILTNKPARVKEDVPIHLPHPRDINDPEFVRIRNYITEQIKWW